MSAVGLAIGPPTRHRLWWRSTRWRIGAAALALFILGIISARIGFAPFQFRLGALTLLTGWIVATLGLATWQRAPASLIGPVLCLTAGAWFVPGFAFVGWPLLAGVARWLYLTWVGVLAVGLLGYPSGRVGHRWVWAALIATGVAAVVPSPRQELILGLVLGASVTITWATRRRERWPGYGLVSATGVLLGATLATWRALPAAMGLPGSFDASPLLMGVLLVAAGTVAAMVLQLQDRARQVSDLVVELGPGRGRGLDGALRQTLGDPTFHIGLWLSPERGYVDPEGRPFEVGDDGDATVTDLAIDGMPVARLVHASNLPLDPSLRQGIMESARLATVNASLQADVRDRIALLEASRDRMAGAAARGRAELQRRLEVIMAPQLDALEASVRSARPGVDDLLPLVSEIVAARRELRALAEGLGPDPDGSADLSGAVRALATRCRVPVSTDLKVPREPDTRVRGCVLFVVSEALTNIARHSGATSAWIELASDDHGVRLQIGDDGSGGADPARGTGLSGLRTRVESLGGHLDIRSTTGHGTRLTASMPVAADTPPGRSSVSSG